MYSAKTADGGDEEEVADHTQWIDDRSGEYNGQIVYDRDSNELPWERAHRLAEQSGGRFQVICSVGGPESRVMQKLMLEKTEEQRKVAIKAFNEINLKYGLPAHVLGFGSLALGPAAPTIKMSIATYGPPVVAALNRIGKELVVRGKRAFDYGVKFVKAHKYDIWDYGRGVVDALANPSPWSTNNSNAYNWGVITVQSIKMSFGIQ